MNISFGKRWYLAIFIFAFIGFIIYVNTLDVQLFLDDQRNITENVHIRLTNLSFDNLVNAGFASPVPSRPVSNLSFALNYYVHQYSIKGYHLTNIVIHILSGIFLFLFIRKTFATPALSDRYHNSYLIAFLAALLWLVNPVQTQSVTYVVQRMNSLAAMFYVLSFWLYIRGRMSSGNAGRTINFTGSLAAGILALGSKEIAVTLPFFILLYEWYFFHDLKKIWSVKSALYISGTMALLGMLIILFLGMDPSAAILNGYEGREFTLAQRLLTEPRVILFYISLFLFPHLSRLNLEHEFLLSSSLAEPLTTLLSIVFLTGAVITAFIVARKHRLISFCILWFLGNLVIESSVIGLEIIFEHRMYLPSMFLSLIIVLMITQLLRNKFVHTGIVIAAILLSSLATYARNDVWRDPVEFWRDSLAKSPGRARVYNNLAVELRKAGKLDEAIVMADKALQLDPRLINAHVILGNIFSEKGDLKKALEYYQNALNAKPDYAELFTNMGNVYIRMGLEAQAKSSFERTLALKPDSVRALVNLASVYAYKGETKRAIVFFEKALALSPENPDIYYNLGLAYSSAGRLVEARVAFSEVLKLNPGDLLAGEKLQELSGASQ